MTAAADTLPVAFTVLGVQRVPGVGPIVAHAIVELDVAGVVITLQGVQVRRQRHGVLTVHAPQHRAIDGRWRSAVVLPDALRDALGAEVLAALQIAES